MIAAAGPTPLWYAARSTGYVSLLMLTAILVLGILTSLRWSSSQWPRFASQAVHRNLSLLVLVFLLIHIVTSVADPFAGISILNSTAPFTGSYRPVWLGLGVVSMELLGALVVTSLLRQRIGFAVWRVIHWTAYACWPLAVLHTLGTGSDVKSGWAVLLTLACGGAVVLAIGWRLLAGNTTIPPAAQVAGLVTTGAATFALIAFAVAGPLHSGWAKSAGTPDSLLAATTGATGPTPAAGAPLALGLSDTLSGTVTQGPTGIQVNLTDARDPSLRVVIDAATRSPTGRLLITQGGATVCDTVASLAGDVTATCGQAAVDISLNSQPGGTVAGLLLTQAAAQ